MALYHKWDVKNDFAYVLQFFSLISDSLGIVLFEFCNWFKSLSLTFIRGLLAYNLWVSQLRNKTPLTNN